MSESRKPSGAVGGGWRASRRAALSVARAQRDLQPIRDLLDVHVRDLVDHKTHRPFVAVFGHQDHAAIKVRVSEVGSGDQKSRRKAARDPLRL